MSVRRLWSRDELLLAFRLYCRTPFGKLHQHNPEIIDLAGLIHRTPSAIAMKACNFASLDPVQRTRNIAALRNASRADRSLWKEFRNDPEAIASEAEQAFSLLNDQDVEAEEQRWQIPKGPTEIERVVRGRRVQHFFRASVLACYELQCALSGISIVELLNASHIIPWSVDVQRRADPTNGICLNTLYDRAFDRGFITFDEAFRVVISPCLRMTSPDSMHQELLVDIEGRKLEFPSRFGPDQAALTYHREHIFRSTA